MARKPKKPKKKWYQMTSEEKLVHRAEAAARNKKRLANYDPMKAAINAWRREFSRSPVVIEMMNENRRTYPKFNKDGTRSKIDGIEHLCNVCAQWKRSTVKLKVVIDHIEPFIDPETGFVNFDTCFARLWCARENLQKICGECHLTKSMSENLIRSMKVEGPELDQMEECTSKAVLKKYLRRYDDKRLGRSPYPSDFKTRILALRGKLSKM